MCIHSCILGERMARNSSSFNYFFTILICLLCSSSQISNHSAFSKHVGLPGRAEDLQHILEVNSYPGWNRNPHAHYQTKDLWFRKMNCSKLQICSLKKINSKGNFENLSPSAVLYNLICSIKEIRKKSRILIQTKLVIFLIHGDRSEFFAYFSNHQENFTVAFTTIFIQPLTE